MIEPYVHGQEENPEYPNGFDELEDTWPDTDEPFVDPLGDDYDLI